MSISFSNYLICSHFFTKFKLLEMVFVGPELFYDVGISIIYL